MDGERLKRVRTELGLTQTDFGIILGYNPNNAGQAVSDLENGRRGRLPPRHIHPLVMMLEAHGAASLTPYLETAKAQKSP